ncbi:hypothetical protein RQN30_07040 [Arcanobacterium hippocoleae]
MQVEDVVLGKEMEFIAASAPFVYTTVPPYVVKRSIADEKLKAIVLAGFKRGIADFPLNWKKESLAQKFWARVNYYHQISKFKKYLWDAGKKVI